MEGQCLALLPDGAFCNGDDRSCQSEVCDDFDLICCNRICFDDEFCNFQGKCETFQLPAPTPTGTPAGTATATVPIGATATPTATFVGSASPTVSPTATSAPVVCPGDCDGSGEVLVDEIIDGVALLLGRPARVCAAIDLNEDGGVSVDEVVSIVNAALRGCGSMLR
jgi:hypothetical protein